MAPWSGHLWLGTLALDRRPLNGGLSAHPVAHALSTLGALFRWLVPQRYVLANSFAGMKVCDATGNCVLDLAHAFCAC